MTDTSIRRLRELAGVVLLDVPRYLWASRACSCEWIGLRNRAEIISPNPDGPGVACRWQWSSELHAPKVVPLLGVRLLRRCLEDYPIRSSGELPSSGREERPQVSFIIGHRGMERLPHLLSTIGSLAAQEGVRIECLVVEQSPEPEIRSALPGWVRYMHDPTPDGPYNRSRTFNQGARRARGELLVLHDNDMLVPGCYARELHRHFTRGFEVVNLKRFIFYLTEEATRARFDGAACSDGLESIVQNLTAGGSIAISRDAYFRIGGMDEAFVGWGGEDVEFWERAQTLNVWHHTYLPLIHLWHRAQREKNAEKDTPGMRRLSERSRIPAQDRITELRRASPFPEPLEGTRS